MLTHIILERKTMTELLQEFQKNHMDLLTRAKLRAYGKTWYLAMETMAFVMTCYYIFTGDVTDITAAEDLYIQILKDVLLDYYNEEEPEE